MAALVSLPVWRRVRSAPGPPGGAGDVAVALGGGVAHGLEGVAPGGEVLRAVGHQLELEGLDLGAVLLALEVSEVGHELVGGAVEALGLGVEHVDEAPEQALALVGDLEPVGRDGVGEEPEGFLHGAEGLVGVPDVAGVELVALGRRAEECRVLADGGGSGLSGGSRWCRYRRSCRSPLIGFTFGADPRCDVLLGHARTGRAPGPRRSWAEVVRKVAELGAEDRSAIFTVGNFHGPP